MMNLQDSIGESLLLDESVLNEEDRYTLRQLWQPAITREEVFFTGKENIEGFVCLLSYFLPQMIGKEVDSPSLINIDNHDFNEDPDVVQPGQLFFQSVVEFKDSFTRKLPKHVRNKVHTLTVKVDFNNVPVGNNIDVLNKLCKQSFNHLNLKDTLEIRFPTLEDDGTTEAPKKQTTSQK